MYNCSNNYGCSNNYDYSNYNNYDNGYNCGNIESANFDSNCNYNCDYTVDLRTELIINQSPQTISDVLQELCSQGVDIDGYSIQALCDECSVFRFVVGSENCQKLRDIQVAQSILSNLNVEYLDDSIFKVTPRANSNKDSNVNLANLYSALQRNVTVNASYPSTTSGLYFQATPIDEALNTLRVANFC